MAERKPWTTIIYLNMHDFPFLLISLDQYYRPPNNFKAWLFNMRIYIYIYSTLLYIGIITMCLLYMYRRLKWYLNVDAFCSLCNLSMMKSTSSSSAERQPYGGYLTWGEPPKSTVFSCYLHNTMVFGVEETPIRIGSMYGIYANIWGILMVNVTIYSIHGSYNMG